ncbi:single-stranded DNA-binding protein [Demequina rhizosphaerae]|uniref:single-stranded DNA-binding protein n=1 Tax=Demequina rhizosphaerae TaxID=1638985 RepID=UPI0007815900|nr:single-stranded DNA-binding protein [Demequina rhizosphaerae]
MNELTITVAGWAATDVRLFKGQGDLAIASFRVASTPRYFDRDKGTWVDGVTEWFTVRVFRGAAITVSDSIRTGMPVVVTGRLRTSTWEAKDGPRVDHLIDATAVGPDCMRGVATFRRATGDASLSEEDMSPAASAIAASKEGAAGDDAVDASSFETEPPGVEADGLDALDREDEPEPVP